MGDSPRAVPGTPGEMAGGGMFGVLFWGLFVALIWPLALAVRSLLQEAS